MNPRSAPLKLQVRQSFMPIVGMKKKISWETQTVLHQAPFDSCFARVCASTCALEKKEVEFFELAIPAIARSALIYAPHIDPTHWLDNVGHVPES